jgi:pimeloyl-ACP methyl ester carboxylesterase
MYPIKRQSRTEFIPIRNLSYHVRLWGEPASGRIPLVMVHGWMDVAASYQFVVDALADDHYVIAPDWRGYGLTDAGGADNFWFPDYLADLDGLLDHYAQGQQVNLVGHSMGGNVVMWYAGVRPERIRRLINLEGFGMPATRPSQAPGRYAKWIDELKSLHQGEKALRPYDTLEGVARRLTKTNPRLARDAAGQAKALWLAQHWAKQNAQGSWDILGDPAHKIINANLYNVEEVQAIYQRITAPTLAVEASDNQMAQWWAGRYSLDEYHERLKAVPNVTVALIEDAGHMLHHDQPEKLAHLIADFIA